MGLLNFGTLQIDLEQRRVFTASSEIIVEPKMFEVLSYLIKNSARYVSLQELHTEVWAGRVVTDTAVRRTISKLRSVLGDTETETPLYIKSQMKRGYQFIGKPINEEQIQTDAISTAIAVNQLMPSNAILPKTSKSRTFTFWLGIVTAALMMLMFTYHLFKEKPQTSLITAEPLVTIAGEKLFLSISENGRYQAFTARLNKNEGWQPYLYDRKIGQLHKLQRPKDAPSPFVSLINNENVVVSAVENGESKLHFYSIANLEKSIKRITLKDFSFIGQVVSYEDKLVLINGQKKTDKNLVYYLLNIDDETFDQFTYSSVPNSIDAGAVISPDKKHFAFIRRAENYHVQVLRSNDKARVAEEFFDIAQVPTDEINLVWLDNGQLLINGGNKFKIINVTNSSISDIPISTRFSGLGRDEKGNLFGLIKQPLKSTFYEVKLNDLSSIQRYFSFNGQALDLSYSQTPDKFWLVEKTASGYELQQYNPDNGEKNLHFKSQERFTVIAEKKETANLLVQFNSKKIKMLDYAKGKLTDISDINQQISYATFAEDKNLIFFTEQIGDEWHVNSFDLQSTSQRRILKGYRLLLPWRNQFIVADAKGTFFLLNKHYEQVKQLPLTIEFNLLHQVSLRGEKLIAANIGVDSNWKLMTLDLVSGEYQQQVTNSLPIQTTLSFNNEGTGVIVAVDNSHENQLVITRFR